MCSIAYEAGCAAALEKLANVPTAVKQYRRARELLRGGDNLFHGVLPKDRPVAQSVRGILNEGLWPQLAAHGSGVYLWKDRPRMTYMRGPEATGFAMRRDQLPAHREPVDPHPTHPMRRHMLVFNHAEGDPLANLKVPARSSLVAPSDVVAANEQVIRERRLRRIDPAIFHRAEAEQTARDAVRQGFRDPAFVQEPTRQELMALHTRRGKPTTFGAGLRGGSEDDIETFLENYENFRAGGR